MSEDAVLSPGTLSSMARDLYADTGNVVMRAMQQYRPYICPLHDVIDEVPRGSRVLDVGCGGGLLLMLLADLGRIDAGLGFDVSHRAIKTADKTAARMSNGSVLRFEHRAIEDGIPLGDFDVITTIDVLHHVPPAFQQAFVQALCRAVPDGGRLIIKDMVARPRWRSLANRLHDLVLARQWVHHADMSTVETWVHSESFVTVRHTRVNTFWYGHWMLVLERGETRLARESSTPARERRGLSQQLSSKVGANGEPG